MSDHADKAAHYSSVLKASTTTRRLTIEVYALDTGTDLAAVSFEFAPTRRDRGVIRPVKASIDGQPGTVGLWRIVPENADG